MLRGQGRHFTWIDDVMEEIIRDDLHRRTPADAAREKQEWTYNAILDLIIAYAKRQADPVILKSMGLLPDDTGVMKVRDPL